MINGRSNSQIYVAPSPIHGRGLFAARHLAAGQLIGIYEGPRVEEDGEHVLWLESECGTNWTGYDGKNELRFMNHSVSPNAEMDGLQCFCLVDILPGTEITIDYGWEDS